MAVALSRFSAACALLLSGAGAANLGDSASLVQWNVKMPALKMPALKMPSLGDKASDAKPAPDTESAEDKRAAPVTKAHFQALVKKTLANIDGMNPLTSMAMEPMIVSMLMDQRHKATPPVRTLMDGLLAMDLHKRNFSQPEDLHEVLLGLSKIFYGMGNNDTSIKLHNASLLVPAIMHATNRLNAVTEAAKANLTQSLEPIGAKLYKDMEPHLLAFRINLTSTINKTLLLAQPEIQELNGTILDALNDTMEEMKTALHQERFSSLRTAMKLLFKIDI